MFDFSSDDPLRFVIGQPITTKNELINEVLNQSGVTPEDILQVMQETVILVRLDPVQNPLNQLMTGHDLKGDVARGEVSLDDVAEFIVSPADFIETYIDLIDTFLEVRRLPRIHMRGRRDVLFVQGSDLLHMTQGPPPDIVKRFSVIQMFGLGNIGIGLFENQAVLLVQDGHGEQVLLEVFWEGNWRPSWKSVEPDPTLIELIYTLLGLDFTGLVGCPTAQVNHDKLELSRILQGTGCKLFVAFLSSQTVEPAPVLASHGTLQPFFVSVLV